MRGCIAAEHRRGDVAAQPPAARRRDPYGPRPKHTPTTGRPSPGAGGSRVGIRALGLLLAGLALPALGVADAVPEWSYSGATGPEHWGALAPAFETCGSGQMQSPIDIRDAQPVPYTQLMFQYRSQGLEMFNDGHVVHVFSTQGSELRVRGESYALTEIHFHVPGEHRVNGVGAAAEIHFVHRDVGARAVIVAVPVTVGRRRNSTLARIVERLPLMPGEGATYRQVGVNPVFLLPTQRDYFSYTGSLATPPCTEPVRWFVMAHPLELEAEQVGQISRATGVNARAVQPLNGRTPYAVFRR